MIPNVSALLVYPIATRTTEEQITNLLQEVSAAFQQEFPRLILLQFLYFTECLPFLRIFVFGGAHVVIQPYLHPSP